MVWSGQAGTVAGDMSWCKAGDGQAETNIIYLGVFTVLHQRNPTGRWPVFVGLVSTWTFLRREVVCSALFGTEIPLYVLRRRPLCMGEL